MLTNTTILVSIILGITFLIVLVIVIYAQIANYQKKAQKKYQKNPIKNRQRINLNRGKTPQKKLQNPINFTSQKSVKQDISKKTNLLIVNSGSNHLRQKIINLLYGDVDAANRLIAHCQKNHPHKSIDWYLEKVIWDLEKDRRF